MDGNQKNMIFISDLSCTHTYIRTYEAHMYHPWWKYVLFPSTPTCLYQILAWAWDFMPTSSNFFLQVVTILMNKNPAAFMDIYKINPSTSKFITRLHPSYLTISMVMTSHNSSSISLAKGEPERLRSSRKSSPALRCKKPSSLAAKSLTEKRWKLQNSPKKHVFLLFSLGISKKKGGGGNTWELTHQIFFWPGGYN